MAQYVVFMKFLNIMFLNNLLQKNQFIKTETLRPSNMINKHKRVLSIEKTSWSQLANQLSPKEVGMDVPCKKLIHTIRT